MNSIPNKFKAFSNFYEPIKIVFLHEQDSNDCKELKGTIQEICHFSGDCPVLIHIVCRELEAWNLGDMPATESAYPKFNTKNYQKKEKFSNPDLCNAFDELRKSIPKIQKGFVYKNIPKHFNIAKKQIF